MDEKKTRVVNGIGYRFCEECKTWRTFKELPLEDEVCEYCLVKEYVEARPVRMAVAFEKTETARFIRSKASDAVNEKLRENLIQRFSLSLSTIDEAFQLFILLFPNLKVSNWKDRRIYINSSKKNRKGKDKGKRTTFGYVYQDGSLFKYSSIVTSPYVEGIISELQSISYKA